LNGCGLKASWPGPSGAPGQAPKRELQDRLRVWSDSRRSGRKSGEGWRSRRAEVVSTRVDSLTSKGLWSALSLRCYRTCNNRHGSFPKNSQTGLKSSRSPRILPSHTVHRSLGRGLKQPRAVFRRVPCGGCIWRAVSVLLQSTRAGAAGLPLQGGTILRFCSLTIWQR